MSKSFFVVDTNVVIDYSDIIPNGNDALPDDPTVDTTDAHIVVPEAVRRELSKFKGEKSERGKAAREALRRLAELMEGKELNPQEVYELRSPVKHCDDGRMLSVLPVPKGFAEKVSLFGPRDDDMDDQIILTALYVRTLIASDDSLTLLTNDKDLVISATANGIRTRRYGYKHPAPYTGRRDNVVVPFDLYHRWQRDHKIELEDWLKVMPNEPALVANEFIIMRPLDWQKYIKPFSNIGRYSAQQKAIVPLDYARNFPIPLKHDGHACYAEALYNPEIKMVVVSGVAGTGKTYMGTVYAYEAVKGGDYYWAAAVIQTKENDGIGYRKGDLTEKLDLNAHPVKSALRNYFLETDRDVAKKKEAAKRSDKRPKICSDGGEETAIKSIGRYVDDKVSLDWSNWFMEVPVPYAKGHDFAYTVAFVDEVQDLTEHVADMVMKRPGRHGKIIYAGDLQQIHEEHCDEYSNGLSFIIRENMGDEEVACVLLYPEEVMRDDLVKRLTQRQRERAERNNEKS